MTAYFQSTGHLVGVDAVGENQQTLEVHSDLIGKPFGAETNTLIFVRKILVDQGSAPLFGEISSDDMLHKCMFTNLIISGSSGYHEAYKVD